MVDANPTEIKLIEAAAAAVQRVMGQLFEVRGAVLNGDPSALSGRSRDVQQEASCGDVSSARPELAALHYLLTSSSCLLEVSRSIMELARSPQEQPSVNNALTENTKAAGRAAYRAALILADLKVPPH